MAADEIVQKLKVEADTSDAQREVKSLGDVTTKSMLKAQAAFALGTKALTAFGDVISDGVKAADEYQKTNIALEKSLAASGHEVRNNTEALNEQSAALERQAGISDETIRGMQALAINMGVSATEADKFTRAAISLSNTATNVDVNSAMRNLIKTTSGLAGELGELVPGVRDLTKEQLESGEAIRLVNDLWGANLGLLNEGFSGKLNQLSNAFASVKEALVVNASQGQQTLPDLIEATARALEVVATALTQNEGGIFASLLTLGDIAFTGGANLSDEALGVARGSGAPSGSAPTGPRGGGRSPRGGGGKAKGKGKKTRPGLGAGGAFDFDTQGARDDLNDHRDNLQMFFDLQQEAADRELELEDKRTEALAAAAEARLEIARTESEQRKQLVIDTVTAVGNQVANFTSGLVSAFERSQEIMKDTTLTAEEAAVASEAVFLEFTKGFLKSLGNQLIGQGITAGFQGGARLLLSYGADPTGYGLLAQSAAMIGAGIPMLAGGLSIQVPQTPSGSAGGGGGGVGGGGGTPTAGAVNQDASAVTSNQQRQAQINAQFFVVGELSEQQTILIQRSLTKQAEKGFVA